jgi:DNA-binding transcriptional MocR family regulator
LVDDFKVKVKADVYRSGEEMPSLRKLHGQTGLSITTAYQAYIELEKRGVVIPRPKSGYYVKPLLGRIQSPPEGEQMRPVPKKVTMNTLAYSIVEDMSNPEFLQLGGSVVMPELLPFKQLTRCLRAETMDAMKRSLMRYENPHGNVELKRQITNTALAIARTFPEGTRITAPQGGLTLWVVLDKKVDGLAVYQEARKKRYSSPPVSSALRRPVIAIISELAAAIHGARPSKRVSGPWRRLSRRGPKLRRPGPVPPCPRIDQTAPCG